MKTEFIINGSTIELIHNGHSFVYDTRLKEDLRTYSAEELLGLLPWHTFDDEFEYHCMISDGIIYHREDYQRIKHRYHDYLRDNERLTALVPVGSELWLRGIRAQILVASMRRTRRKAG